MNLDTRSLAPPLRVSQWFNSDIDLSLEKLRSKVVLVEVFQMLCPACVMHSMPQAGRLWQKFRSGPGAGEVAIIGLHSVFEHHDVMTPQALVVYLHEFRIPFPVGVDMPGSIGRIPQTMQAYGMQGTPTALYIDRDGRLRRQEFGTESDDIVLERLQRMIAE